VLARDFLEDSAGARPEKTALVCGAERMTYAALDGQANRFAAALRHCGVRRGDRVVIQLPNGSPAAVALFGALKAGAAFVPLNPSVKADKLQFVLENCRAIVLVTDLRGHSPPRTAWLKAVIQCASPDATASASKPAQPDANGSAGLGLAAPEHGCAPESIFGCAAPSLLDFAAVQQKWPAERPPRVNREEDLACLIYTSGSTGRPKGVMCEHRNVVFASASIIQYLENRETDVVLNALPLSFDYGLYQLLMTVRFGGTLVLENSFAYPAMILRRITEERVTGLPGVPTLFNLLLAQELEDYDLSSLRYLTNTAAALPPARVLELRRRFPQARLYSMYGLTETKRTLYLPPEELERRPGSVGVPIPGTEAWLQDERGRRLGLGQTGELVIRGPHVMRGYWEDAPATAQRFRPGLSPGERLCYSGDLFRQDQDGFFYFVGRKDDIIKSRGEKVAPREIEDALYSLPGVAEAAVIGVPDALLGQAVKAIVVCRGACLTEGQVLAHCRAHLEDFMVPQVVEFWDALPKNASGKIDKLALREAAPPPFEADAGGRESSTCLSGTASAL